MRLFSIVAALVAALVLASASPAQLFSDDFNTTGSSANYNLAQTGETATTFAFDYSTLGIPPAPGTTDGTTLGVKFEANMTSGAVAAATLHTNQQFTGSYTVKFDAWINANGPMPLGGTGSTEFLTAGVGGDGFTVNRLNATGIGGWTAVDGEGGSGVDYRLLKDTTLQDPASTQYAAGTHSTARNATDAYYAQFGGIDIDNLPGQGANSASGFFQQTGISLVGTFGFAWHEVELVVDATAGTGGATSMAWSIDGLLIGTLDAGIGAAFATDGSVTVGYSDPFASVSDNAALSFGLVDNLVVTAASSGPIPGDFNNNGAVENADLTLLLNNWGAAVPPTPNGWNGIPPTAPAIDNDELTLLLNNWGKTAGSASAAGGAVPEPASAVLGALAAAAMLVARRRP